MANGKAVQSPLIRRITSWMLAVLILSYVGFQVYRANTEMIQTETAGWISTADSFTADGVFIRKETVITADYTGELGYEINDGGHVAKNGVVAQIYPQGSPVDIEDQIEALDNEMESLQNLLNIRGNFAADPGQLDQNAEKQLIKLLQGFHSDKAEEITSSRRELLYTLNEKQILTGTITDFSARIAELQEQKAALQAKAVASTGTVRSPEAGYFTRQVDGYEKAYSYEKAEDLTVEQLQAAPQADAVGETEVGRVVTEYGWYFACVVDADTAAKLKGTTNVELEMSFSTSQSIPAQVAAVNQQGFDQDAVVVFYSDYMNESVINARYATVTVNRGQYTGVQVNQKAVHFSDIEETVEKEDGTTEVVSHENVQGVYVMESGKLKFVQIFPLLTIDGYVICDVSLSDAEKERLYTDRTVELYDEVVVGGSDLYDGRVIS